jgi:CRP/FNR family cyclic AMP-dependent transcriptional regulator
MMHLTLDMGTVLAGLGLAFSLASFIMKRMLPLRVLAIGANLAFIAFALSLLAKPGMDPKVPLPGLLLNAILLPVNARRLWEIKKLSREITRATQDSPLSQWLLPHMHRRAFKAGDVLFRKGEVADKLIYIASGHVKLAEIDGTLGPGELLGEIGLFSPDKLRTQTLVCETDGELYEMTDEMLFQLYYQHPKVGFYIVRLIVERLLKDVQRQQTATQAA